VQTLFLAMALYPDMQKKAQAEIDTVVGPNRLPDFHDRHLMSYINAILKETLRWNLVVPLGRPFLFIIVATILTSSEAIPHMSTIGDEYNGFYIPKGTIVIGNAWLTCVGPLTPIFCPEYLHI
jgi:Cytochrome P450